RRLRAGSARGRAPPPPARVGGDRRARRKRGGVRGDGSSAGGREGAAGLRGGDAVLAVVRGPEALLGQAAGGGVIDRIRRGALGERSFRLLFAARTISFFGTNLAPIA